MSVITIPSSRARVRSEGRYGRRIRVQLVGVARVARARFVAVVALLCVAALVLAGLTPSYVGGGRAGVGAATGAGLAILPVAAEGPISAVLGRDLRGYRVEGLVASNPVQRFRAVFSRRGVAVVSGRMRLGLALDGYGYATAVRALAPVRPAAQANRVLYARGALQEWWANGPAGLEQGFTVSSRPRAGSGPLTFSLGLTGDLRARLEDGGVSLSGAGGALRYGVLVATDARGRALRAWFALHGRRLLVEVDDRDASYPVRVDPLLAQSGELISSGGTAGGEFGGSVAVFGDTVVVGAKQQTVGSNILQGAVYVFVEPAAGWQALGTQTAELTASNGLANDELGSSVAVYGNTIVASAPGVCYTVSDSSSCLSLPPATSCYNVCHYGVAYVFVQPAGGWSGSVTQSAELNASNQWTGAPSKGEPADFGTAVAVSGDTIVVGDDTQPGSAITAGSTVNNDGAAYVFQQPGGGWSGALTQSAELTGAGTGTAFGSSVAVSGSTVAVGAPGQTVGSNIEQGAVDVYMQPASGWAGLLTPSAELTASDGTARDGVGHWVAASGNTIAAAGEDLNLHSPNVVFVFAQPAAGWSGSLTQSAELGASNEALTDAFGLNAVAVSGATVVVGAPDHHRLGATGSAQGAAYVFTCPAATAGAHDQAAVAAGHQTAMAAAPRAGGCPLTVKVTGSETLTSGLTHRRYLNPNFARFFGEDDKCQSGCTDLVVTVTDPSNDNKPVPEGTDVQASVQPIPGGIAPYPLFEPYSVHRATPGAGYLCIGGVVASAAGCGNGSLEVTTHTDDKGQVKLRYWAPGVLQEEKVLLTVKAQLSCTGSSSCPLGEETGETSPDPTLTIEPNVVIGTVQAPADGQLTPQEEELLAEWTKFDLRKSAAKFLTTHGAEAALKAALKKMFEAEAEGPVALAAFIAELSAASEEEQGFMALVLNAFNVRERGLGDTSTAIVSYHREPPTPARWFLLEFAADNGPFGIDGGGLTWRYGKALELSKLPRELGDQIMHLRVYEVSYCQQGLDCGPGYQGLAPGHRADGIQPYLYFDFFAAKVAGYLPFADSFITPYNAEAWLFSQFG